MSQETILNALARVPIYLLVLVLPLFFLPFTSEAYEFNKIALLFSLVLISTVGWLGASLLARRTFAIKRTPLDIPIGMIAASALLSTVFSQDWISSLFGLQGRFSGSLIELFLWIAFYSLIVQNFTPLQARRLFHGLFASSAILALWFHLFFWQRDLFSFTIPPVGLGLSLQALSVFQALTLAILLCDWVFGERGPRQPVKNTWYVGVSFLAVSNLVVINFAPAWIILVVTALPCAVWTIREKILEGKELNYLSPLVLTLLIALGCLIISPFFGALIPVTIPYEVTLLSHQASWQVIANSMSQWTFMLFGTGPANFLLTFALFRPVAFNYSGDWAFPFDAASSHYGTIIATTGTLGIAALLFLVTRAFFLLAPMSQGQTDQKREASFYGFGLVALLVSFGLYYQNSSLALVSWLFFAALALTLTRVQEKPLSTYRVAFISQARVLVVSLFFAGVVLAGIVYYGAIRLYRAEIAYKNGFSPVGVDKKIEYFTQAVRLNPYRIHYHSALAQSYLAKMQEEIAKPGDTSKNMAILQQLAAQVQQHAQEITDLSPRSFVSWEQKLLVQSGLLAFVDAQSRGALVEEILRTISYAQSLQPTNPALPLGAAQLLLAYSDDTANAEAFLRKASALKEDYVPVLFAQAALLEKQNTIEDAISLLDRVAAEHTNTEVQTQALFEIGRLAYRAGQPDKAVSALEKAATITPSEANIFYLLGLAHEATGNVAGARGAYERVLKLDPDNPEAKERITALGN